MFSSPPIRGIVVNAIIRSEHQIKPLCIFMRNFILAKNIPIRKG